MDLGAHWIDGTEGNPVTRLACPAAGNFPYAFVGGENPHGCREQLLIYGQIRNLPFPWPKSKRVSCGRGARFARRLCAATSLRKEGSDLSFQTASSSCSTVVIYRRSSSWKCTTMLAWMTWQREPRLSLLGWTRGTKFTATERALLVEQRSPKRMVLDIRSGDAVQFA